MTLRTMLTFASPEFPGTWGFFTRLVSFKSVGMLKGGTTRFVQNHSVRSKNGLPLTEASGRHVSTSLERRLIENGKYAA